MKVRDLPKKQRQIIHAWCMYDWANSSYATSAMAAIVPQYFVYLFTQAVGSELIFLGLTITPSAMYSIAVALSTAVVALSSPILGVLADRIAIKKKILWLYTVAGALITSFSIFVTYLPSSWFWLGVIFFFSNIAFSGGLVFYNSLLPHIAPKALLDNVSSRGFAYGYFGGGLLLAVHLGIIIMMPSDWTDFATRMCLMSVGAWWFLWALWTIKVVPEPPIFNPIKRMTVAKATSLALNELGKTFKELKKFKMLVIYLIAYVLFNDGIQTISTIAPAFGADTLKISTTFLMATILIIQFVATAGSMGFSKLADLITTKNALIVCLIAWCFIGIFGVALAPLTPSSENDYSYSLKFNQARGSYEILSLPELTDSQSDEFWKSKFGNLKEKDLISVDKSSELLNSVKSYDESQFSILISEGPLRSKSTIGPKHPSALDGPIGWWPKLVRTIFWSPLNIPVEYQFLILGIAVGLVLGGSQALARSLFAKISPETRSAEFFSFFAFMGRTSAVIGPVLYSLISIVTAGDNRLAILSILIMLVIGTIYLTKVNVEEGEITAQNEDNRIRSTN